MALLLYLEVQKHVVDIPNSIAASGECPLPRQLQSLPQSANVNSASSAALMTCYPPLRTKVVRSVEEDKSHALKFLMA